MHSGIALAVLTILTAQDGSKYFPTRAGTKWTYEVTTSLNGETTGSMEIVKTVSGPGQMIVNNTLLRAAILKVTSIENGKKYPGDDEYVVCDKKAVQVFRLQGSKKKQHVLMYAFPAELKKGQSIKGTVDGEEVELSVDEEEIEVPAGKHACFRIGFKRGDRSVYLWVAQGVGIVRYERTAQGKAGTIVTRHDLKSFQK